MPVATTALPRLLHAPTRDALDLLDAAGVVTFTDLAEWDAPRLQHRLALANASARRVGDAPPVATVAAWIAHARRSTQAVTSPAPVGRFPGLRRLYYRFTRR
ncbi:MAG: DUF4332 domain-containing protein [Rubricoccaceae bacterium]|nr:DUF4332 domain-containing protein [Rubricoccaceae bacterium]